MRSGSGPGDAQREGVAVADRGTRSEEPYHFVSVADAEKTTPAFPGRISRHAGLARRAGLLAPHPQWFAEFDKMLTQVPIVQWKAYLRFHAIKPTRRRSARLRRGKFRFSQHSCADRRKSNRAGTRAGTVNGISAALGQLYVAQNFPPNRSSAPKSWWAICVSRSRRASRTRLDERSDQAEGAGELAAFTPNRYPDKWRDWSGLTITRASYIDNIRASIEFITPGAWQDRQAGRQDRMGMTPQT